ncbi:MAG: L-seryl-tRNA(Sec) selenium transferase [candidate division WOR-3 bacterium]|nr:L-seryl-tRNA(Sec) selenium transferase [candidate division WOR-3 bacterium]
MLKLNNQEVLKNIPSVDKILNWQDVKVFEKKIKTSYLTEIVRYKTDEFRQKLLGGERLSPDDLKQMVVAELKFLTERYFTYAINALGVILHTGLGRAPFAQGIDKILQDVSQAYARLQIDDEGKRDDRYKKISKLLRVLTGCEAGIIVNNNAGATLLVLSAIAKGKEVVVSRGQLIEIGGSFRLPEIMAQSGCILREVGTTNRTHLKDYEQVINENTGAILRVHQSNYRIIGFTSEVPLAELVSLGKKYQVPVIDDLGSGALIDFSKYGLPKEPMAQESIALGADIVCFSGDKLIGGPQCGIIIGKKAYLEKIKKHPLTRALRCDKLTNAVLEATLQKFLLPEEDLINEHTVYQLMLKPLNEIKRQANWFARKLKKEHSSQLTCEVKPSHSEIGGGSLSTEQLPTFVVIIKPNNLSSQDLAKRLRQYQPPIFGRIHEDSLILDFRTVLKGEEKIILQALQENLKSNDK